MEPTQTQVPSLKKRGRPARKPIILAIPKEEAKTRGKSEFTRLVMAYRTDTIVRAFVNLRRKLFLEGENVDQMTASIRKRISDLQNRGNVVH